MRKSFGSERLGYQYGFMIQRFIFSLKPKPDLFLLNRTAIFYVKRTYVCLQRMLASSNDNNISLVV